MQFYRLPKTLRHCQNTGTIVWDDGSSTVSIKLWDTIKILTIVWDFVCIKIH